MATVPVHLNVLEGLPNVAATDVKNRGWKAVVRLVRDKGAVLVTNHAQPDAVIVTPAEYARLRDAARQATRRLDETEAALRQQWTERLAWLDEPGAGEFLRSTVSGQTTLKGAVKAGDGW